MTVPRPAPIRRVALVYPVTGLMPPLGLLSIAAALESAGIDVIACSLSQNQFGESLDGSSLE